MSYHHNSIKIPFSSTRPVFAAGSESKCSFAVLSGDSVFLSRVYENLRDPRVLRSYMNAASRGIKKAEARVIAHDLHPEYVSTRFLKEMIARQRQDHADLIGVQHHHAHAASCMVENGLRNKVIAVVFDGTGYGPDGSIWGGEFLTADYGGFNRRAHLARVPMPGSDKAVLEPMRMAFSYLYKSYGRLFGRTKADVLTRIGKKRCEVFSDMLDRDFNAPLTSSAGRFFDAVSSLIGLRDIISFEGEAAIALEKAADGNSGAPYDYNIKREGGVMVLEFWPMVRSIVAGLKRGRQPREISRRFHGTMSEAIKDVVLRIRRETGIDDVVLSGGVFQNKILLKDTVGKLKAARFSVYTHSKTSCSDISLSLGQAVIASRTAGKAKRCN